MDPKANLEEQLDLARDIEDIFEHDGEDSGELTPQQREAISDLAPRLAELVLALDEWRRNGGFDPYGR